MQVWLSFFDIYGCLDGNILFVVLINFFFGSSSSVQLIQICVRKVYLLQRARAKRINPFRLSVSKRAGHFEKKKKNKKQNAATWDARIYSGTLIILLTNDHK